MVDVPDISVDIPDPEEEFDQVDPVEEELEQSIDIPDVEFFGYEPKGHTFTIYEAEEIVSVFAVGIGGALVAYAIIWLVMRVLDGGRRNG
ncbi:hypothetical protein [Solibacillus sp. FSL K6-1523]|uniref:hypothetical protein n=1 Tax=Solibacillus sp. FSL K6-1523 TaxID=2921471 RepID=UPI0030F6A989